MINPFLQSGHRPLISFLAAVLLWTVLGCAAVGGKPIDPADMVLPKNGRLLLFSISRGWFGYRIEHPPDLPTIADTETVRPPRGGSKGPSLDKLVKTMIRSTPADLALGLYPMPEVRKRYHPYRAFRGWRTATVFNGMVDGRPIYRQTSEPIYETRFKYTCTARNYRVYLFDSDGDPMGATKVQDPAPVRCPETADADVVLDEIGYLADWVATRLGGSGQD
jgi:hypothetical protein